MLSNKGASHERTRKMKVKEITTVIIDKTVSFDVRVFCNFLPKKKNIVKFQFEESVLFTS